MLKTAIKTLKQTRKTYVLFFSYPAMKCKYIFTLEMNHTAPQNIWTTLFLHKNVSPMLAYQMQTLSLRKIPKVMFKS